jgi:glycosyltransferase involved in cell wall biosynthesis
LTDEKGVWDLVEAAEVVARSRPLRVVMAGAGPEHAALAAWGRKPGRKLELVLAGYVDGDAKRLLLATASVLVLPSWQEACPIAVLEGLATGLPVVASDVGRVRELVPSDAGLVVPPRDRVALAAAICAVLDRPFSAGASRVAAAPFAMPVVADRVHAWASKTEEPA